MLARRTIPHQRSDAPTHEWMPIVREAYRLHTSSYFVHIIASPDGAIAAANVIYFRNCVVKQ